MKVRSTLCLLFLLFSAGCTPSTPRPTEDSLTDQSDLTPIQSSPTPIKLPSTWTPTPTLPPTQTATITLTPAPKPTNTPRPTREATGTPIVSDSMRVSLAAATLKLSDLPTGFTELPIPDNMQDMMLYQQVEFEIATFAAFMDEQSQTAVMSMTFVFTDEENLEEFDKSLSDVPDELEESASGGVFPSDMGIEFKIEIMEDFQGVGNKSTAFRIIMAMEEESIDYEIAMFRRGPIGASVFTFGVDELPDNVDLHALATLLDQRIIEAFSEGE